MARLLVVDDDSSVRKVTVAFLAGHEVVEASSGREAVDIMAADTNPFDALVTDVEMPGMTGPQLASLLRIPTLFVTGALRPADHLPDGSAYLQKPFRRENLLEALSGVLQRK